MVDCIKIIILFTLPLILVSLKESNAKEMSFLEPCEDHWSQWMAESPCTCSKIRARVCSGNACMGSDREVVTCSQDIMTTTQAPQQATALKFLVVVGGSPSSTYGSNIPLTEAFNLPAGSTCSGLPDLPWNTQLSMSAVVGGRPVVCGGTWSRSNCSRLNANAGSWENFPSMNVERRGAATVQLTTDYFWVGGGSNSVGDSIKSTELYDPLKNAFAAGMDLPVGLYRLCAARINDTHIVVTGGRAANVVAQATAYIIDVTGTGSFVQLPNMQRSRFSHGCGVVERDDGSLEIIVAGGAQRAFGDTNHFEVFSFSTWSWTVPGTLPEPIEGCASVPFGKSLILVGSRRKDLILEYNPEARTWMRRNETLSIGRNYATAVLVGADSGILC